MNNIRYNISAGSTLWLLLCTSIIGYLLVGIVGACIFIWLGRKLFR